MRKLVLVLSILLLTLAVAGCGGGGDDRPLQGRQILSDDAVDADVVRDAVNGSLTVTPATRDGVVFAGIDPVTLDEYRAFLDFPLGAVPEWGIIQAASLDIFINAIHPPAGSVPIRLELVSFAPPVIATDFQRDTLPPLAVKTIDPPITARDVGNHVVVDVTDFMRIAQANKLPRFQVRVMEDLGVVVPGLIEIDDSDVLETAPLLRVAFF